MNHYLYKIINRENGKFYIGVHSCKGDYYDSRYWGSGCFSKDAKKNPDKYLRVLICQAESRKEVLELEALFVTQELVDDPMCYNLKTGGIGGSHANRSAKETQKSENRSTAQKGKTLSEETKAKISAAKKGNQNMLGMPHSEELKLKYLLHKKPDLKSNVHIVEKAGGARVMHRWHFDNCKSR
jgi:hypothetical protein